jgi:hypothetical protein
MQYRYLFIVMLFAICIPCFAQEDQDIDTPQDIDTQQDINTLIKRDLRGLTRNFDSIQREAANLDETERLEIYNRYEKNVWGRGVMGLIPFGIGSFINGDYAFGGIFMAGEAAGGALVVVGAMMPIIGVIMIFPILSGDLSRMIEFGETLMKTGGIIAGVFYLFGIIRGFYYPHAYNKKLKTALGLESDSSHVSIIPSVDIIGNKTAVTLLSIKW